MNCNANCHLHGEPEGFHVATCDVTIARDRLAAALGQAHFWSTRWTRNQDLADALMPVVQDLIAEGQKDARRKQQLWDRSRVEDYAAVVGVELTPGDDMIAAVDELYRTGAAAELREAAHRLDDGGDEAIEVALGGASYVHRVLCDRAHALDGKP